MLGSSLHSRLSSSRFHKARLLAGAALLASIGCAAQTDGPSGEDTTTTSAAFSITIDPCLRAALFNPDPPVHGKSAIYWRNYATGQNRVWNMVGKCAVPFDLDPEPNLDWVMEGAADFSGDGQNDILWRNYRTGENKLWIMADAAHRSSIQAIPAEKGLDWHVAGVGFLNGDGRADILWQNLGSGKIKTTDTEGLELGFVFPDFPNGDTLIAGLADFDGDHVNDVLTRDYRTGKNQIWLRRNGLGIRSTVTLIDVDPGWWMGRTLDEDGDGFADIAWRHKSGANSIWTMNGTTPKEFQTIPSESDANWQMAGSPKASLDRLAAGMANLDESIPLVAVFWEHEGFQGRKRELISDERNFRGGWTYTPPNPAPPLTWGIPSGTGNPFSPSIPFTNFGNSSYMGGATTCAPGIDFNDVASSVGVHPGPGYEVFRAKHGEPTITLFIDGDFGGARSVTLTTGSYPSLAAYGMNDAVSSVKFGTDTVPSFAIHTPSTAAPIRPIENIVMLHTASHDRAASCDEADNFITLVESSEDLRQYGDEFNDSISGIEISRGPNGSGTVHFYVDSFFNGAGFGLTGSSMTSLENGESMNDTISSVLFTP